MTHIVKSYEDVYASDIVYLRINNTVVAAKLLEIRFSRDYYDRKFGSIWTSVYVFALADGNRKRIELNEAIESSKCYRTIEDAIKDRSIQTVGIAIDDILQDELNFEWHEDKQRTKRLCRVVYWWNGFDAKRTYRYVDGYNIFYDQNGFRAVWKYTEDKKYYETKEECKMSNHVRVVTF